ncbi:MAG: hypothetical protein JNK99_17000 [Candidatus Accumulibacter sp.]|uniref:hypothetical protein n=1 Tax=Accumulibacter sp. TaxID=2053492 RepID=UPI001A3BB2BB|nr:hypothetical protein [Accumulibacter sp.]MBL8396414.1 hypothetical protein [Accumulibacter sp.]
MNEVHEDSPKDPQVSEFYRKHATEQPSTAVDERILAAARVAVADRTSRKVPGWWQRWRTPLALGTTLVLTLSLALLHERRPVVLAPEGRAASQKAAVGRAAPAAATSSEQAADSRLAEAVKRDSGDAQPSLPVEVLRPMVPPSGRVPAERIARLPASNAVGESSEAALPAAAVPHNGTAGAPAAPAALGTATTRQDAAPLKPAPAAAVAPPSALTKSRPEEGRAASDWLDEIRALRRQGNPEEAESQLREFRRVYPDYPLPEEFRP